MSQSDVICGGVTADFRDQIISQEHEALASLVSARYNGPNSVLLSQGACINGDSDGAELALVSMINDVSDSIPGVSSIIDGTAHMDDHGIGYGSMTLADHSKKDVDAREFLMPNLDDGKYL